MTDTLPISPSSSIQQHVEPTAPIDRPSPGRLRSQQAPRRPDWIRLSPAQVLARFPPVRTPPLRVLEVLLDLFNTQHTTRQKSVSHKTRHDRAQFLRRFFRDLKAKAGFKLLPDPRNLGQKHLRAMVAIWRKEGLAPATIQTYLSFLRGLASWLGKHGLVRAPAYYGLELDEYQRHESATRDRSWSAQSVDIDAIINQVCTFDRYVGASLRLIRAMGLRRKESVTFRPFASLVPAGEVIDRVIDPQHARIKGKGGRERLIPLDTPERVEAVRFAQSVVESRDAHMGDPRCDLRKNLRRFDYVLVKFGITADGLGVTAHGLRHEVLIDHFIKLTDTEPPVRGGEIVDQDRDLRARKAVSELAGHARIRASNAYLGSAASGKTGGRSRA